MKINIKHNANTYILNFNKTYDISIPLDFNGHQPNFFNVNKANAIDFPFSVETRTPFLLSSIIPL